MSEDLLDESGAIGFLRKEHNQVQELLTTVAMNDQMDFVRQAMIPLRQELEIHEVVEREFFFPFMVDRVPDDVLNRPVQDNTEMLELSRKLENLDPSGDEFDATLDKLIGHFQHHIFEEEQYLFLQIEGPTVAPDLHNELVRLSNLMRTRREELRHPQKRTSAGGAITERTIAPNSQTPRERAELDRLLRERDRLRTELSVRGGESMPMVDRGFPIKDAAVGNKQDEDARTEEQRAEEALVENRRLEDEAMEEQARMEAAQVGSLGELPADNDPLLAAGTKGMSAQEIEENEAIELERKRIADENNDLSGP